LLEKYDAAYDRVQSSSDLFNILESISPLNRASTNLHNALQTARDHVKDDRFLIEMRDMSYEISRNFELLLTDTKHALDYRVAMHTEMHAEHAERMALAQHKLNVLAAITFPLIAIATIFGMNMISGLETHHPVLFWSVLCIALFAGFFSLSWVIKSKNK
jgi:Mg2+ and Co2+ transporter CorA